MPPDVAADEIRDEIAASFLRSAADTLTARLRKDLPAGRDWLIELTARLGIPTGDRGAAMARARREADGALARARALDQRVITSRDPAYPALLTQIADPPLAIWHRGDIALLSRPAVAVVGARAASTAGLLAAERLGRDLAAAGLVVVSGLARGADGAAHRGALAAPGPTVAVLGCGVNVRYPAEHAGLAREIERSGVVISELPPDTRPMKHHFPLRNRIISGLVRAVVVIEASLKSGSLITARSALDQGRDVLAVPGGIASGRYRGSHRLIKDGARLVETVEDVLEEIRWPSALPPRPALDSKSLSSSSLEAAMSAGDPNTVEDLAARTGRATADVLAELSVLELAGRVARAPGGCFVRVD